MKTRNHHPDQGWRCWIMSVVFGTKIRGGAAWHVDGTNYWGSCDRCGWEGSSL